MNRMAENPKLELRREVPPPVLGREPEREAANDMPAANRWSRLRERLSTFNLAPEQAEKLLDRILLLGLLVTLVLAAYIFVVAG
jgi:hypothetical protein